MKNLLFTCLSIVLLLSACKPADDSKSKMTESTEPAMKYTLTPFTASPEFPDANIQSVEYKDGLFSFGVSSDTYELGAQTTDAPQKMCANSGKGQHIHLIIDDAPYAAKYTSQFEHDVADGEHYMLAFLSRSYHESIKTQGAHVFYKANFMDKSLKGVEEVSDPMVLYSRPKGTYVGKANTDKVMLDFYLANTTLGENKVIVDINGEKHTVETWQPYYIEGLPMGDNTITLTLIDADDKKVNSPLNPVSRTFKLEADPTEGS